MAEIIVHGGETSLDEVLNHDSMYVLDGGVASHTKIYEKGSMFVSSGGSAKTTEIYGKGSMFVSNGGSAIFPSVYQRGFLHILSGGTAEQVLIDSQGNVIVSNGGVAKDISNGGFLSALSGGRLEGVAFALNGGTIAICGGASAENFYINVANVSVSKGGMIGSAAVDGEGAFLNIAKGGSAGEVTVNNSGTATLRGTVGSAAADGKDASLNIAKGGSAVEVTVKNSGIATLCGSVGSTAVGMGGSAIIGKGGTVNSATVNDEGNMYLSNGGKTLETTINEYGQMYVLKGGTANQTTVTPYGWMYLSNGGTASDTTVNQRGNLHVSKGAKAINATINQSGCLEISGGTVSGVNVYYSGYILCGGTVNNATVDQGKIYVSSGGTVNNATVDQGKIYVSSGGKVNNAVLSSGSMLVSSSGAANNITLENGAKMEIRGAKASGVTVKTGGSLHLTQNAGLTGVTLEGGIADLEYEKYEGVLSAYGGTIKGLTIGSGTSVCLDGECTTTKIKWTPGDGVVDIWTNSISFTSKYSGVYLGSDGCHVSSGTRTKEFVSETLWDNQSAYIAKGGYANENEIKGGKIEVWSGGSADNTILRKGKYSESRLIVSRGGKVKHTTLEGHSYMEIESGGMADDTRVCCDGFMLIFGGSASGIRLEYGGQLDINSGGTATAVDWTPFNGILSIGYDAHYTFANEITGVYIGDEMTYHKHEENVQNWTVNDDADRLYVMSGGIAENTSVDYGRIYVFAGSALGTVLTDKSYGGYMFLYEDAYASGTKIQSGGLHVYSGGTADHTTISKGEAFVFKGGLASDTNVFGGRLTISGGSAVDVKVDSGCSVTVASGGRLDDATVYSSFYRHGGYITASSGAVLSDIKLQYGARLYVQKGAKVTNVTSSYGSYIEVEKGASVKITKTVVAESQDTDYDVKNGWADKKKKTINEHVVNSDPLVINKKMSDSIKFDENNMTISEYDNYVGYTDEIDFLKVRLDDAAKLSFDISASDVSKFTVWRWDDRKNKLVSLQSTALKFAGYNLGEYYFAETKELLLEAGDYYLSMESTNAAKGGNAYYNVFLSDSCTFFPSGNNGDDEWSNASDLGMLTQIHTDISMDWVGFGDPVDYRKFTAHEEMTRGFEITATDASKFTFYQLVTKTKGGKTTDSLKKLGSVTLQETEKGSGDYRGTTAAYDFEEGVEYYFCMESTNAAKGGSAEYLVKLYQPSDGIAISDSLSFGEYDADVLADTSAFDRLASMADDSALQNSLLA